MPNLTVRKSEDVPEPVHGSKAERESRSQYDSFIRDVGSDVGELELGHEETVRAVKVRLRRAATRVGKDIDIWDVGQKVYFRQAVKRGRPRKAP